MTTINDVAKLAGVSRGTVSNVINGVKVKPESKKKVDEAIARLGYIPNAYAKGLKSQKTNTVTLIIPSIWYPFFSKLTSEIEENLRRHGYKLLLCISHDDDQREIEYIEMAQQNKVDGILLVTYSDLIPYLRDRTIPMVAIERFFNRDIPFISTDNFRGGEMAARKLHELGCRKICFIGRSAEKNEVAGLRRQGFTAWCKEHDIPFDEFYFKTSTDDFMKELDRLLHTLFETEIPYDGIFTAVDRYADYIVDTLHEIRPDLQIGQDLQLIGFDGIGSHPHEKPKISSIHQPVEELARRAVEMLIEQIEQKECDQFVLLDPDYRPARTTRA